MRNLAALLVGGVSATALFALSAAPATAQTVPTNDEQTNASEEPAEEVDEITVYARLRGRAEQLQDVPIAITAVGSQFLEETHTVDIRDVGRVVPNAQLDGVGTFPGFANFFMRGVGVSTSVRSLDPAVNIVQDGMVVGYQAGAILDTFDMEGVEVLRGPQGVLFGRNASGGVVSVRSKRPTGEFGAETNLTFGNSGVFETRSAIEGTLVEGAVFGRLALLTRNNDGFVDNTNGGTFVTVPANVNPTGPQTHATGSMPETDEWVIRPTLVFQPSDTTTLTLLGQYLDFNDGGGPTRSYLPAGAPLRQQQTVWGWTPTNNGWDVNLGTPGYTNVTEYHLIAELQQELGAGTLTAIAAHRNVTYDATLNVGGDPFDAIVFPDNNEANEQTSLEARYNVGLGDNLELLVGGFYMDMTTDVFERRLQRSGTTTNRTYRVNVWDQDVTSFALFGNLDWDITPQLTLSTGLRYSDDTKSMHIVPLQTCPGQSFDSCPLNYLNAEQSWDDLSPRVVLNYAASDDVLLYASYSRGYRAGNFNARATTPGGAVTPADPETVSSYEVGVKSDLFDNRLRFNLLGFYQEYSDIQRLVQQPIPGESPAQNLFNAAAATISGVEIEVAAVPVSGLRLTANVGYTDAQYDSFNNLTGLPVGVLATDLEFDRVPKWTVFLGAGYDLPVGADGNLSFNVGYSWRSHVFTDVVNTPVLEQDAFGLLDASVEYDVGRWNVSLFGRNLEDTVYAEIKSLNVGYNAFGGTPRYYGIEFGVRY